MNAHKDFETDEADEAVNEYEAKLTARIAEIEPEVVIAHDGHFYWAVVSLIQIPWLRSGDPWAELAPTVVVRTLQTREAAEVARRWLVLALASPDQSEHLGDVVAQFDAAGRVLQAMRRQSADGPDLPGVALVFALAARGTPERETDIPF